MRSGSYIFIFKKHRSTSRFPKCFYNKNELIIKSNARVKYFINEASAKKAIIKFLALILFLIIKKSLTFCDEIKSAAAGL